jgi:hypothetical protein
VNCLYELNQLLESRDGLSSISTLELPANPDALIVSKPHPSHRIRPKLAENTGSRPLAQSQAAKRRISSWVGDDQRIPSVVCFFAS